MDRPAGHLLSLWGLGSDSLQGFPIRIFLAGVSLGMVEDDVGDGGGVCPGNCSIHLESPGPLVVPQARAADGPGHLPEATWILELPAPEER